MKKAVSESFEANSTEVLLSWQTRREGQPTKTQHS